MPESNNAELIVVDDIAEPEEKIVTEFKKIKERQTKIISKIKIRKARKG